MSTKDKSLFSEFPPVSTPEWEAQIKKDLKGADYKEKLRWHSGEGIEALPFYRKEDLKDLERTGAVTKKSGWEIRQPIYEASVQEANAAALEALEKGADALQFICRIRSTAGALGGDLEGTAIQDQQSFNELVDDIELHRRALHFDTGMASPIFLAMLHNYVQDSEIDTDKIKGSFLYDPFAFILTYGQYPKSKEQLNAEAWQMADFCSKRLPGVRPLAVDARIYHSAGGTIVQELGYALAAGNSYMNWLTDAGMDAEMAAESIHFNFAIGSNYFLEIAKFRAARLLWNAVLGAYDLEQAPPAMYLHGESSQWNKTVSDPYTNMLRTTTEGISAALAGCDSITLHPFDAAYEKPDTFSQRIARNTQVIFKEEAHLDKVADPAAGSYYVETLTDKIAKAAWKCFQEIEQQGGLLKSAEGGYVQTAIQESRNLRDQAIARRGRIFVGTNQYPNPAEAGEELKNVRPALTVASLEETQEEPSLDNQRIMSSIKASLHKGCALGDLIPSLSDPEIVGISTIHPYRGAEAFENLRLATKQAAGTPKVLTLPLGNRKMRKARSAFAVNFFGCAGYEIKDRVGFESMDEAVSAIRDEDPDIVVLCSSDVEYKELVPALCNKLSDVEKAPIMVLAGYPKEDIDAFKEAGIDEFIHARCNVLETLNRFHQKLGIIEH